MKENKDIHRILTYFTQFSINMIVPIFLCSGIGYLIDNRLGTNFCFVILFFVGALAGFRNIYIMVRRFTKNTDEE